MTKTQISNAARLARVKGITESSHHMKIKAHFRAEGIEGLDIDQMRDAILKAGKAIEQARVEAENPQAPKREQAQPVEITEGSLKLLQDLWEDRDNWSGTPLFGGNTDGSKAAEGHLTHLKQLGLVQTIQDDDCSFVEFLVDVDAIEFKVVRQSKRAAVKAPKAKLPEIDVRYADKVVRVTATGQKGRPVRVDIRCQLPGCSQERNIATQDLFQVSHCCVAHKRQHQKLLAGK